MGYLMHWFVLLAVMFQLPAVAGVIERRTVGGIVYHIAEARPAAVRIVWQDDAGKPLRTLGAAWQYLEARGETPRMVMNGGIFEPGGIPSGLMVQGGKLLRPLNLNPGEGNFFLKPNGIFSIRGNQAVIVRSERFPNPPREVDWAVQSGPLLLEDGQVHRAFRKASESRLHRNGVGVAADGRIFFAMTDFKSPKFPNLHEFAELFRALGCTDALFLDGDISQMRTGEDLDKPSNRFGSIIAVVGEKPGE